MFEDLGGAETIEITWCKGHARLRDVEAGRSTERLRMINGHADHFACKGSAMAVRAAPAGPAILDYNRARAWYKWLHCLVGSWPDDTRARPPYLLLQRRSLDAGCTATGLTGFGGWEAWLGAHAAGVAHLHPWSSGGWRGRNASLSTPV